MSKGTLAGGYGFRAGWVGSVFRRCWLWWARDEKAWMCRLGAFFLQRAHHWRRDGHLPSDLREQWKLRRRSVHPFHPSTQRAPRRLGEGSQQGRAGQGPALAHSLSPDVFEPGFKWGPREDREQGNSLRLPSSEPLEQRGECLANHCDTPRGVSHGQALHDNVFRRGQWWWTDTCWPEMGKVKESRWRRLEGQAWAFGLAPAWRLAAYLPLGKRDGTLLFCSSPGLPGASYPNWMSGLGVGWLLGLGGVLCLAKFNSR